MIASFLDAFDQAWLTGDFEALRDCFDPDAVLVAPGFSARLEGRDAVVSSYEEFLARATIDTYDVTRRTIDIFETSAVVAIEWSMAWTADGQGHAEDGRDLLVLEDTDGWRIVWRTVIT